jgi:hypothetical protein
VRVRGAANATTPAAQNVRVFFRMWSTQSADTDFQAGSTYRSQQGAGHPRWPLAATDSHTFPFFATGNSPNLADPANAEYGTNGINNRAITIASGDLAYAYFGCFLNVYDAANVVNGSPVQTLMAGTHHCLVSEIAYDDAPIINANGLTASPENSDKLAQRNLQVTHSDNPGPADTHRVPQTFDLRPSQPFALTPGLLLDQPDELMIDWGATPPGSVAHIYWPQVNAIQVLDLASRMYGTHQLSASDTNTIDVTVAKGVTYVPIPPGVGERFAGLLTVDLPTTIVTGEEFRIVIRRVATRRMEQREPVVLRSALSRDASPTVTDSATLRDASPGVTDSSTLTEVSAALKKARPRIPRVVGRRGKDGDGVKVAMLNWRYVVGTFEVRIPVANPETMLWSEENTFAIMKWRLQQMDPKNRWRPVLERYVGYLAARVDGLGGDSTKIEPSPDGVRTRPELPRPGDLEEHAGKVCEVLFDCFGDFEGFVLEGCCTDRHVFRSRERATGELAIRACKERLVLVVWTDDREGRRICRLALRC